MDKCLPTSVLALGSKCSFNNFNISLSLTKGNLCVKGGSDTSPPAETGGCFSPERPGDPSKKLHSECSLIPYAIWRGVERNHQLVGVPFTEIGCLHSQAYCEVNG